LFRLHFVFKNDYEKFGVDKNRNLEMIYLLKASAYIDEKDNRFKKADTDMDILMHLAHHLDHEDKYLKKSCHLLQLYQ
jgi:hypothetical protein